MNYLPLILASVAIVISLIALFIVWRIFHAIRTSHILVRATNVQLARLVDTSDKLKTTFDEIHNMVNRKASSRNTPVPGTIKKPGVLDDDSAMRSVPRQSTSSVE